MAFGIDLWKIVLESNCSEETERDIKNGLDELYAKAKAWDSLKELLMKEYPSVVHLADVSNGDDERGLMNKHEEVLEYMDELDGTDEFRNLLSDMEDE